MHAPVSKGPILSVVLCTRNASERLRLTLESLCRQTLSRDAFEVVVVDDGSTDGTREVTAAFESRLPLRRSFQREAGTASARNHGVFLARGAVLLFLEEDVAEPDLLERHLEAHRRFPEPRFAVLGRTQLDPSIADDPLMRFVTGVAGLAWTDPDARAGELLDWSNFRVGRSSCKRALLLYRGIFDSAFRCGGEDVELGYRLSQHGFRVAYEPGAVSRAVQRWSIDDFRARMYQEGRATALLGRLHDAPEVRKWTEAVGAPGAWPELAPAYEDLLRSAHELDRLARVRQRERKPMDGEDLAQLHRSYWALFQASRLKGMADMASW